MDFIYSSFLHPLNTAAVVAGGLHPILERKETYSLLPAYIVKSLVYLHMTLYSIYGSQSEVEVSWCDGLLWGARRRCVVASTHHSPFASRRRTS